MLSVGRGTPATSSEESQPVQIRKQGDQMPPPAKQMFQIVSSPEGNHVQPVAMLAGPEPTFGNTCDVSKGPNDRDTR
jgi:hypothetical protein